MNKDSVILQLAKKHFDVDTLDARNNDTHDFHEVSVWSMKSALNAAYEAGLKAASVKEEHEVPALFKAPSKDSKRMRELAGIPDKGNYV